MINPTRETTAFVLKHARHVRIQHEEIKKTAKRFLKEKEEPPTWGAPFHYISEDTEHQLAWLFLVDAMNFCFWARGERRFRCREFAATMKQLFEQRITENSLEFFFRISFEDFCALFNDNGTLQLKQERWEHARSVSEFFLENYNGNIRSFITETGMSAPKLVHAITSHVPSFRDEAIYQEKRISFHKRAQLLVSDIWGSHAIPVTSMEYLTAFADYRIPQLLYSIGVLQYTPELESRIRNKELILAGNSEEVEIRAATVQAVELLTHALNNEGTSFLPFQVDWLLWNKAPHIHMLIPHHRTVTTAY